MFIFKELTFALWLSVKKKHEIICHHFSLADCKIDVKIEWEKNGRIQMDLLQCVAKPHHHQHHCRRLGFFRLRLCAKFFSESFLPSNHIRSVCLMVECMSKSCKQKNKGTYSQRSEWIPILYKCIIAFNANTLRW